MKIFDDIKNLLGYGPDETDFDDEILSHLKTAVMILGQLGVGPPEGIEIDVNTEWSALIGERKDLEAIRRFAYVDVKLTWDPPTTGPKTQAFERERDRLEWRINVQAETNPKEET